MPVQRLPSVGLREFPRDGGFVLIALRRPREPFAASPRQSGNPTIHTLGGKGSKFNLRQVEPRAVLRGIVQCKLLRPGKGRSGREDFREGARGMGVQIVLHAADGVCLGIMAGEPRL